MPEIRKLLVANRGEIAIRVFRSAHELGIRTVAIYSHEDRFAIHRLKADEAYQIGKAGRADPELSEHRGDHRAGPREGGRRDPPGLRLPVGERRVRPRLRRGRDRLRRPARRAARHARRQGRRAAIGRRGGRPRALGERRPGRPGRGGARSSPRASAIRSSSRPRWGAAAAGCGSSRTTEELDAAIDQARREAGTAFGVPDVFLEKFIRKAKHIEVQLLGDRHGHLVHLYERDCSIQRRHQKVIEIAPAYNLDPAIARGRLRRGPQDRPARRLRQRGDRRVPRRRRDRLVLLHRGQPADPGRAHRHRDGHRRRPDQEPDPHRPGGPAGRPRDRPPRPGRDPDPRLRHPVPRSRPRTRRTTSPPTTAGSPTTARRAGWASGSTAARRSPAALITPFYDSLLVKVSRQRQPVHRRRAADGAGARRSSASGA